VLVVDDNEVVMRKKHAQSDMTIDDYIKEGMVEWVDALEEENMLIAMDSSYLRRQERQEGIYILSEQYTHCEIHPSMMFGVCASFTPFANHNQATKATLQSAMAKQAIGITCTNQAMLFDNINYQLFYPQKPIISTKASKYLQVH
jgi:DNA-directed RNA polymerase II subunit RPB2